MLDVPAVVRLPRHDKLRYKVYLKNHFVLHRQQVPVVKKISYVML